MKTRKKIVVFIADPSAIIRQRLVNFLVEMNEVEIGGQADTIPGISAGLAGAAADVVILAIPLPGGSGIEALQFIKQNAPLAVVIVMTRTPDAEIEEIFRKEGADFFFDQARDFEQIPSILSALREDPGG